MNLPRMLFFTTLLVLMQMSCFAETMVENEAISKGDDSRLNQIVSCSAEGMRITDILDQLSTQTGVIMNAGTDNNDWMVRDRKVIVFVNDMKLRDLMQELASILRFHWSRGGEQGKWTYRLWQDKVQYDEQMSLLSASDAALQFREKRDNILADIANLGSLSANDAAALKTNNPWRYVLASQPLGKDMAEFFNGFPEARNAFVQGFQVSFPVSRLQPNLQDTVKRIAHSYDSLAQSIGASEDHSEMLSKFDRLQITINRNAPGKGQDIVSQSLLGTITVGTGIESFDVPLFDPSSAMAKALGKAIVSLQSGAPKDTVGKQLQADMTAAVDVKQEQPQQSARDTSSDPALKVKVKLYDGPTAATLPMVLKLLAEISKMNIVSDYFLSNPQTIPAQEISLGDELEQIRMVFGSNWTKAGSTLRFRDKEWFKKRTWEVPQVWIDYLLARAKKNDGLQLDDLVLIAAKMRDEQIDHTIMADGQLVRLGVGDAARNRQILRFYSMLDDKQRDDLTKRMLSVNSLNDQQWATLQKAVSEKGVAYTVAEKKSQYIQLVQGGSGFTQFKCSFKYYSDDKDPVVMFDMLPIEVYKTKDEAPTPNTPKK